jgi:hypothetical protein
MASNPFVKNKVDIDKLDIVVKIVSFKNNLYVNLYITIILNIAP